MFPRSFRCHFYVSFSLRFNTPIYLYRSLELGRSLIVMMLLFRCRPILSVSQIPLLLLLAWRSHLIILARGICFSFIPSDAAGLSFRRRTKLLRPLIFYLHCMSDLSCYSFHFFRMRFFFFRLSWFVWLVFRVCLSLRWSCFTSELIIYNAFTYIFDTHSLRTLAPIRQRLFHHRRAHVITYLLHDLHPAPLLNPALARA